MTHHPAPIAVLALAILVGCGGGGPEPEPEQVAFQGERDAAGRCWDTEPVPAIYEQVPGQIQVVQAEIADDGTVLRPPIYRNTTVPKVVRPRGELRFEVPCPESVDSEFIASVQRALAARSYYEGPSSGQLDAATGAAIRRYQSERGLDSATLSLETARALGLVAIPRETLEADATETQ